MREFIFITDTGFVLQLLIIVWMIYRIIKIKRNMKKGFFLILLILICIPGPAQNLGFNGSGFFQNYDSISLQWIREADPNFVISVPDHAGAKFMDPIEDPRGWGLDSGRIAAFKESGYQDEDNVDFNKWYQKTATQPNFSYLDRLADLQRDFHGMRVLWTANLFTVSPGQILKIVQKMKADGESLVGVEMGSETYGQLDYDWTEYRRHFEPVRDLLKAYYPDLKISLMAAPIRGRGDQVRWNDSLDNYQGVYDAITQHFYLGEQNYPEGWGSLPAAAGVFDYPDQNLQTTFNLLYDNLTCDTVFDFAIESIQKIAKGKEIWLTEYNTQPADAICNTWLNGAWLMKQMITQRSKVKYLCVHNGIAPDLYGMISRTQDQDLAETDLVKRTGYYAYQLAVIAGLQCAEIDSSVVIDISTPGTHKYFFISSDPVGWIPKLNIHSLQLDSATVDFVQGDYLYSSAGKTGWTSSRQPPSMEISGLNHLSINIIPPTSWGVLTLYTKTPPPVPCVKCGKPKICWILPFLRICKATKISINQKNTINVSK